MADEKQIALLRKGVRGWNAWRKRHENIQVDLAKADLHRLSLEGANLTWSCLMGADLSEANLFHADLFGAELNGANLSKAELHGAVLIEASLRDADLAGADCDGILIADADLTSANLVGARLGGAELGGSNLSGAVLDKALLDGARFRNTRLTGASLKGAVLGSTVFEHIDLSGVIGLESCRHECPSVIDFHTLQLSGLLPLSFLRGVGFPDHFIDYLPSLVSIPIQHYSCFISYSNKDQVFARRLHADLQDKGVRCWFAPHDLPIGAKTWDAIDKAIRLRDKLLLILSEQSIASNWVEDEVNKAFAEERARGFTVLFPVRIDNSVFNTEKPWACKLRDQRNIGDFTAWKDHDAYQISLSRLLRDLAVQNPD